MFPAEHAIPLFWSVFSCWTKHVFRRTCNSFERTNFEMIRLFSDGENIIIKNLKFSILFKVLLDFIFDF